MGAWEIRGGFYSASVVLVESVEGGAGIGNCIVRA
jgi:hypothetical protein